MLTVNYGDRDSKKTTVILVKCRTAFVAEHVKQHRCSFETILFTIEGIAFSVIRTSHHAVCSNRMFCILFTARKKSTCLKSTAETWPHCHSSAKSPSKSITSAFAYVDVSQEWDVRVTIYSLGEPVCGEIERSCQCTGM